MSFNCATWHLNHSRCTFLQLTVSQNTRAYNQRVFSINIFLTLSYALLWAYKLRHHQQSFIKLSDREATNWFHDSMSSIIVKHFEIEQFETVFSSALSFLSGEWLKMSFIWAWLTLFNCAIAWAKVSDVLMFQNSLLMRKVYFFGFCFLALAFDFCRYTFSMNSQPILNISSKHLNSLSDCAGSRSVANVWKFMNWISKFRNNLAFKQM